MSEACSTQSVRTTWPRMSRPRICSAFSSASAGSAASLIPPALPRPPVRTWALTTTGPPSSPAAARAPSGGRRGPRCGGAAGQRRALAAGGAAGLLGRRARLLGGRREPAVGDGDPNPPEELLAL